MSTPNGAAPAGAAPTDTVAAWRAAAEAGDAAAAAQALAPDVVLVSPLTNQFVFRGRDELHLLLESVFEVLTDIRFTDELRDGRRVALFADLVARGVPAQEAQRLELNDHGQIARITLFLRPLPALTGLLRGLGPRVTRRDGRRGAAAVLRPAGALLDAIATSGDRQFVPLGAPASARGQGTDAQ